MIDTLLAHLDAFDTDAVRAAHDLPDALRRRDAPPPGQRRRPRRSSAGPGQAAARDRRPGRRRDAGAPARAQGPDRAPGWTTTPRVHLLEPLGYVDFVAAVRGAAAVVTDSGGVQEETTILGVPCLTVRPNTERPITITHGTNRLVTPDEHGGRGRARRWPPCAASDETPPLWDGHAGRRIARVVRPGTPRREEVRFGG